jgi:5-deoxy-glucuronate isomerase
MLTDTLFRVPRANGMQMLQRRGDGDARELTTRRLRLEPGGVESFLAASEETVVVLQQGRGAFEAGGHRWPVSRKDVFVDRATALYLPPARRLTVRAETALEAILFSAVASAEGDVVLVPPESVHPAVRGRDGYSREVHDLLVSDSHVQRLMVGETFNPPGHWSSFPPHKHDGRDGEPKLEEAYYYRIEPAHGFAIQTLYTAEGEAASHLIRDGDAVLLPYGYHPVASPPGYRLYYLWALAGAERKLALHEDPAHRWIHDARDA